MKTLISMVEFVLSYQYDLDKPISQQEYKKLVEIHNHALFLKTPLHIGQFIACDLEGNVLGYPKDFGYYFIYGDDLTIDFKHFKDIDLIKCKQFKEAQSRVLFDGVKHYKIENNNIEIIVNDSLIYYDYDYKTFHDHLDNKLTTIEDLVGTGIKLKNVEV